MGLPRPCLVADMVTDTTWAIRRTRFYFTTDTPPAGITDVEAICNRLMAVYPPALAPLMTTQVKILRFEGHWFGSGTTGWEGNSTVASVQGSSAAVQPGSGSDDEEAPLVADTLPDEVSLIIQKRTGNTGRQHNGRWFFTGLSEKVQNHGVIAANYVTTCKNLANLLSTDVTVTGSFSTILHARHYNQKDGTLMPITKCYVIKTMGTRLDRRRPLALERA